MIIDIDMDWLPPELLSDDDLMEKYLHIVPRAYNTFAYLGTIPGTDIKQIMIEKPKGYIALNMGPESIDPKDRIAVMDEGKIDKAILRVPCFQEWLTLEMCKQVNDGMAAYAKKHKGRFHTVGVVPPWGDKASLHELERCVKELGCVGIEVATHYGTLYLDCEEFRPFFKKISKLNVPVCVRHTVLPVQYDSILNNDTFRRQFGRCQDQAIAVGREIFSDLFEEFPNLKLVHSMLGGGFFAFSELLAPKTSKVKEELERFDVKGSAQARKHLYSNIYFGITVSSAWGAPQVECAVKVFGADRLLFGCSYPVRKEWITHGVDFMNSLNVTDEERKLMLGSNAQKLFGIR
jgi:predicted TIM-barrel fold metal-dependent hydrolase